MSSVPDPVFGSRFLNSSDSEKTHKGEARQSMIFEPRPVLFINTFNTLGTA